ncbi:MAG: hypothetical protein CM15mP54_02590 [Paracoccaceae bacterium]|nr:MAG: hypothetical protein CM15mP54_02590 [Paracoccaceae bacterium]
MIETCDVAIIGAGPAGANAGIMAASQGCHTIIMTSKQCLVARFGVQK